MGKKLLEVKDLHTSFFTANGEVKSVNGISYYIDEHEIVAVVGESGCGKSVTQMSVMQLVQSPPGKIKGGEVLLEDKNLLEYGPRSKEMQAVRGAQIAMIFQEPMTTLCIQWAISFAKSSASTANARKKKPGKLVCRPWRT